MNHRPLYLIGIFVSACAVFADTACSTTYLPKSCRSDGECGSNLVCIIRGTEGTQGTCAAAKDFPIRVGQSAAASGPSQDLGLEMKRGVQLAFDAQNATAEGGIRGRPLELEFRDDQYTPDL